MLGISSRVVHLDVEEWSEELLRQLSYAIKNQLVASKAPYSGLWNAKYPKRGILLAPRWFFMA